jgi:hypothetical protein
METRASEAPVLERPETRAYLDETVRVWLGLPEEPPSLPPALARLLLRLEEHESVHRDRWGRWEFGFSEQPLTPALDHWVAERRAELGAGLVPLWPDGQRFAVCLTHDVDLVSARSTPRQVLRSARAGLAADGGGLLRLARPAARIARALRLGVSAVPPTRDTLERSVDVEGERGVPASYLFTAPPAARAGRYDCVYAPSDRCRFRGESRTIADVMRTLAGEGFDVGLHGSYGAAARRGALAEERATLEAATGLHVTTTRQHLLHWDVRWSPALQEEAGLRVDSSLGFNRNVGFRAGTSLPFRVFDAASGTRLRLLEVPLIVQDVALLGSWGLQLNLALARAQVARLLDAAARLETALTLVFHPDKLESPDWLALYEWTLDHALERGGWLTSLAGLADWWETREARVLGG